MCVYKIGGSSGSSGIFDMNALNRGQMTSQGGMSAQRNSNLFPLLPVLADSAENIMDGIGGKRKRRLGYHYTRQLFFIHCLSFPN